MGTYLDKNRNEIIETCEALTRTLKEAKRCLGKARFWSIVDIMFCGIIFDFIKYSKMDEAETYINVAQIYMKDLRELLQDSSWDVYSSFDDLEGRSALVIADYSLDNIITDGILLKRINSGRREVVRASKNVKGLLAAV